MPTCSPSRQRLTLASLLLTISLAPSTYVQGTGVAQDRGPASHPVISAVYAAVPPTMDGRLDDVRAGAKPHGWRTLGCIDVNQEPPEQTTALICVDDTAIYLAVICHDRTPEDIVATETRRTAISGAMTSSFSGLDPWHAHDGRTPSRSQPGYPGRRYPLVGPAARSSGEATGERP